MSTAEPLGEAIFVDQSDQALAPLCPWPPVIVSRDAIEREIQRLAALARPANGIRASAIVHPCHTGEGNGISPGFDAVLHVLRPGEATAPIWRNSNRVEFCLRGCGSATVNGEELPLARWDTCNIPAMQRYQHRNVGDDLFVWLSFSNAPLLEKLGAHYAEYDPPVRRLGQPRPRNLKDGWFDVELPGGARLQSAEYLSDIEVVPSRAHLWRWNAVKDQLAFAPRTDQRDMVLLYNPATERRAGTSASFFVTILGGTATAPLQPPVRWGHRHTPAALFYQMMGSAIADIDGKRVVWEEGDLVMGAPTWAQHSINVGVKDGVATDWALFALQDHPPHIAQESLIWQDDPEKPIAALGHEVELDYLAFAAKRRTEEDAVARTGHETSAEGRQS